MKKYSLALAAVAALLTLSCSVNPVDVADVQPGEDGEITVLTATFAGADDETRTVRQADGKVFWSPGDEISVIRGTSANGRKVFVADNTEPAASASFTGTMPSGAGNFWAVYPYRPENYYDGDYLVTTLPAQQDAVAGSFADDLFISAAYVKNGATSLTFYHQCGGFKFTLTQPGIRKVTLIPADPNVFLAGLIGLGSSGVGKAPSIRATGYPEDMSVTVELSAPEGETLKVGEAYHLVTIPARLTGGFQLLFEKEDGTVGFRTVEKDIEIRAAHFATLMEADKGVEFAEGTLDYSPGEVRMDGLGGVFGIHVSGTLDYHIDPVSDWIHEMSVSGDPLIDRCHGYYADRNEDGVERTGMLTICYGENCYPILVTQSAAGAVYPHRTLGMRFTATWCQYCPMMDETFRKAKSAMGDAFEYVCIYDPSGDYGFDGAGVLNQTYQISGFPSGILDGRIVLPNYNSTDYGAEVIATVAEETVKYYPTATAIGISSTLSDRTLSVKVDVRARFEEDYKLTVFLCENNIIGNQQNGSTVVSDFNHSRVTRMSLTSYMGDLFEGPEAGGVKSLNYTATIPSGYDLANMEIVAFVQRSFDDRPAIQSASYGEWYVDNCRSAALGATASLEVE